MSIFRKFFFLILFTAFSSSAFATHSLIVDTDAAIDDAIAILYLLSRNDVDIKAITIAATGEAHCDKALRNMQGIMKLAHKKNIPMACGRDQPLTGHHQFPNWLRESADNLYGMTKFLDITPFRQKTSAMNLYKKILQQSHVDILALGPLTNVAEFIQTYPTLTTNIRRIIIMGGAVNVPGTISLIEPMLDNKRAEWNFYIDPYAAKIVLQSKLSITLVPLDATNDLPVDENFYQRLAKTLPNTPVSKFVYQLFHDNKQKFLTEGWYFWDPLAAVVAVDNSVVTQKQKKLIVLTTPENLSGAVIEDNIHGNLISVCTHAKIENFYHVALQTLMPEKNLAMRR